MQWRHHTPKNAFECWEIISKMHELHIGYEVELFIGNKVNTDEAIIFFLCDAEDAKYGEYLDDGPLDLENIDLVRLL